MAFLKKYKLLLIGITLIFLFKNQLFALFGIIKKPIDQLNDTLGGSQYGLSSDEMKIVRSVADIIFQQQKATDSNENIMVQAMNRILNPVLLTALKEFYTVQYSRDLKSDFTSCVTQYLDFKELKDLRLFIKKDFGYD